MPQHFYLFFPTLATETQAIAELSPLTCCGRFMNRSLQPNAHRENLELPSAILRSKVSIKASLVPGRQKPRSKVSIKALLIPGRQKLRSVGDSKGDGKEGPADLEWGTEDRSTNSKTRHDFG